MGFQRSVSEPLSKGDWEPWRVCEQERCKQEALLMETGVRGTKPLSDSGWPVYAHRELAYQIAEQFRVLESLWA